MKFLSNIKSEKGVKLIRRVPTKTFDGAIVSCTEVMPVIDYLKSHKKSVEIYALLEKPDPEAFALLYDFVDAFIIAGFDELTDDIDPIINLRLYNDEYKPIFLKAADCLLYEDLDELLGYSMLSNVDGVALSNPRLLKYAAMKSNNILSIMAMRVNDEETFKEMVENGAQIIASDCSFSLFHRSGVSRWKIRSSQS